MSEPSNPPITVNCPICQRLVQWTDAFPHRPFCSERCKLIDLGAWADGSRTIPGHFIEEDLDEDFGGDFPH